MISEHSFPGAFRDISGEFGKVVGAETFLIRNKDLLFPDVRNRPSDSIRFENPFRANTAHKSLIRDGLHFRDFGPSVLVVLVASWVAQEEPI